MAKKRKTKKKRTTKKRTKKAVGRKPRAGDGTWVRIPGGGLALTKAAVRALFPGSYR